MQLDVQGKILAAYRLYAENCERGYGASCFSIAEMTRRCLYVVGYAFYEATEAWFEAACEAHYSRGCFALYELNYPPDPAARPSWLPTLAQCNQTRAELKTRNPPGARAPVRWLEEPIAERAPGPAVLPVACGSSTCSGRSPICCSGEQGQRCVGAPSDCPPGEHQAQLNCSDSSQCAAGQFCCAFDHLAWCAEQCTMGSFTCIDEATCPAEFAGQTRSGCQPTESGLMSLCLFE